MKQYLGFSLGVLMILAGVAVLAPKCTENVKVSEQIILSVLQIEDPETLTSVRRKFDLNLAALAETSSNIIATLTSARQSSSRNNKIHPVSQILKDHCDGNSSRKLPIPALVLFRKMSSMIGNSSKINKVYCDENNNDHVYTMEDEESPSPIESV
jgi:hypothetical protein